ncbi:MAG: glutamine--fructose-6-phosphate transaminase (isomerizing) [Pseudomonadales bacterium]|nr:glutamine--fructose-6-phosphate transaminase (isomerizing) [Candidatus Woesebacteria bacterium]MCB9802006.1 glutamine--fructose-6-phosphate transaminase (isomerizing) [Pseudomonadales bacterium]
MCGIYVAVCDDAQEKVLAGLKRLEYRGYDSWGVAVVSDTALHIEKYVGQIGAVQELLLPSTRVALGHTRWATHGGVTQANAHPHSASDDSFVLVQNGVVENYQELKASLKTEGYEFVSQTDTEVIVRLLEKEMKKGGEELPSRTSFQATMDQLEGRSTVAVLAQNNLLLLYRNGSPLVLGKNKKGAVFCSSDVLSMAGDATEYYTVENGEVVTISPTGEVVCFTTSSDEPVVMRYKKIDVEAHTIDKNGYAHYMLKEIFDQGQVLLQVTNQPAAELKKTVSYIKNARMVYTLGAGSASFAAQFLSFQLRQLGIQSDSLPSYEARSFQSLFQKDDVVIVFSQSGETADTNEVVEWMKKQGVKVVSIVNMLGSTLTRLSDSPHMLQVGPEVAIASTKALSGQLVWSLFIAWLVAGKSEQDFRKQLQVYQAHLQEWLESTSLQHQLEELSVQLLQHNQMFILGRGQLHTSALEFALKMKEISYIHAEGFSGGELKHGVIALISSGTPVFCLIAQDSEKADMLSAAAEVRARGGWVVGVARENNELFSEWIQLPEDELFVAISSFVPAQLLTYYLALKHGFDPDKPRNLAKSVTVK